MTNAELIKALRWCGDESDEWCVSEAYKCQLWNEDRITDECKAELMRAAADALEAQLPKEGEWIEQDNGNSIYHKCSVCGKNQYNVLLEMMQGDYHYCPNCGAKMRGEHDE